MGRYCDLKVEQCVQAFHYICHLEFNTDSCVWIPGYGYTPQRFEMGASVRCCREYRGSPFHRPPTVGKDNSLMKWQ